MSKKVEIKTVLVGSIPQSGFFRKVGGQYVHKIISPASCEYFQLEADLRNLVYGVTFNGNIASVDKDKPVILCDASDFIAQYVVLNPDACEFGCTNLISRRS